ncbi:hypothetical protein GCM10010483_64420 [Actinokineospora diospyrosa]
MSPPRGGARPRALIILSLLLTAPALPVLTAVPTAAAPAAAPVGQLKHITEAPDIPSARLAARLSGRRVEALSERSESTTTWANPGGTLTSELSSGPKRFQRDGKWVDVDLTLRAQADGSVAAPAHPRGARLAGAGGIRAKALGAVEPVRDLVTLGSGTEAITLQWPGGLPAPRLDGPTATYPDAVPGADVVVSLTRGGFEQFVDIKKRPAGPVSYTLPLKADGLVATAQADGGVAFTDRKSGKPVATMPAPVMWDSTVDKNSGEHTRRAPVRMDIQQRGGTIELRLSPDPAFLADPATTFPVRVDPSTTRLGTVFDTFVESDVTTDESGSVDLKIGWPGTYDDAAHTIKTVARSFITWDTAPIADALVTDAKLRLFNYHSWSCDPREWQVWAADEATSATRWTNQPAMLTKHASPTETRRSGGTCNNPGYSTVDATSLVAYWAGTRQPRSSMGLRAGNEADTYGWKRFYSGNAAANQIPTLEVTYNYRPKDGTDAQAGPPFFSYGGEFRVNTTTPTLRYRTGDADNDTLRAVFEVQNSAGTVVDTQVMENVPAGQVATATVDAGKLTNGQTYKFRTTAFDGTHWSTTWSPFTSFVVDTTAPSAPTGLNSTDYPSTQWVKGGGQSGTFTATPPAADHHWLEWSFDGDTWTKVPTGGAPGAVSFTATPPKDGTHTLKVRSVDRADNRSEAVNYTFHAGPGGFDTPSEGTHTARRVAVAVEADTKYDQATLLWRRSDADPWTTVPPGHVTKDGQALTSWPVAMTAGRTPTLVWTATDTVTPDGAIQVKADFTGPNSALGATGPLKLVVDRDADGATSEEIGPGSVNLLTGNHSLEGTDASFFGLSFTRSANSRAPHAGSTQEGQAAILGDEWVSGISAESGKSQYTHLRRTTDTALDVVLEDGSAVSFTANATSTGWVPQVGAESLTLTGGFSTGFTLTDTIGTVTAFGKVDPAATTWQVTSSLVNGLTDSTTVVVSEKVVVNGTTLARPKRLIAPGAATAAACQSDPATQGCRVLEFGYATATTATGSTLGDYAGQLRQLTLWATPPGGTASVATAVAAYAYDDQGRLREVWDPRVSPALKTGYDYDAAGRVTTLTPPGLLPWTFVYGSAGGSATSGDGMLLKVTRPALQQGSRDVVSGTSTTTVVYGVPTTGSAAPRQLGTTEVRTWGQHQAPTDATAIFPADSVPTSSTGSDLPANGYGRATVHYLDPSGERVNTADPAGNITTSERDKFGNLVRDLTAANRALALSTDARLTALGIAGLPSAERAELLSSRVTYSPDGTRKVEELGPLHHIGLVNALVDGTTTVAAAGSRVAARTRTVTEYDSGRPTDGSATIRDQVTSVTVGAQLREQPVLHADTRVTATGFDWVKGLATSTTKDPGGLAITTSTQYDAQGRVVKTLAPDSTGTDAGTTVTAYYTGPGTGACAGRPEWSGLVCSTGPGGAITGGGTNPSALPVKTTEYGLFGQVTKLVETANGSTRTATTTHDAAGRTTLVSITGSAGTAVPDVTTAYDQATGAVTSTTSTTGGTITRVKDKLGRQVSYTDADNGVSTAEYDLLNRPVRETESTLATAVSSYDTAIDARGVVTGRTDSVAGQFGTRYDANGSVSEQRLPGGYTMRQSADPTGQAVSRVYTRDSDGAVLLSDSATLSVHGERLSHVGSPGRVSSQSYRYDAVGRLAGVDDTTDAVCTRRTYTFDKHSNRKSLTTAAALPNAPCPTSGGTQKTHTHDSADRLVDTGITYDAFGRTTTLPGGATFAYYANDLAQRVTVGDRRQTWTLDTGSRVRTSATESNVGGTWQPTGTKVNHYDGDSDSPRWIVESSNGDLTRNVLAPAEGLAATTGSAGTVLQLTNLHDDVVVALPLTAGQAPVVRNSDEFGNQTSGARYGYLGTHLRSAESLGGVMLMGVRLYSPSLGRFLQTDPVAGGSANAYDYANQDPVNNQDLDGRLWARQFSRCNASGCAGMQRICDGNRCSMQWWFRFHGVWAWAYIRAGFGYSFTANGWRIGGGSYSHGELGMYTFHGSWYSNLGSRARGGYYCWTFWTCYLGPFDRMTFSASGTLTLYGRFGFWYVGMIW